jgi:hypothetical protein
MLDASERRTFVKRPVLRPISMRPYGLGSHVVEPARQRPHRRRCGVTLSL